MTKLCPYQFPTALFCLFHVLRNLAHALCYLLPAAIVHGNVEHYAVLFSAYSLNLLHEKPYVGRDTLARAYKAYADTVFLSSSTLPSASLRYSRKRFIIAETSSLGRFQFSVEKHKRLCTLCRGRPQTHLFCGRSWHPRCAPYNAASPVFCPTAVSIHYYADVLRQDLKGRQIIVIHLLLPFL